MPEPQPEDRLLAQVRAVLIVVAFIAYVIFLRLGGVGYHFPNVGWVLLFFLAWSAWLVSIIRLAYHKKLGKVHRIKRASIFLSLPIDTLFIWYAAKYSGGTQSPFFYAVFVLIVIHAYYFPGYLQRFLPRCCGWVLSGASSSLIGFIFLYIVLTDGSPFSWFSFAVDIFFAGVLALTAGILRHKDRQNLRQLRRSNDLAQLFRDLMRRLNEVFLSEKRDDLFEDIFDDLAETIGKNLFSAACEVFILEENEELARKGYWIRDGKFKAQHETLLGPFDRIRIHSNFLADPNRGKRIGRYQRTQRHAEIGNNPLARHMTDFLIQDDIKHSIFTLILKRGQKAPQQAVGLIRVTNRLDSDGSIHFSGFTEEDEEVIQDVAREISVAIENYRLQSQLTKVIERERRMRQLALKDDLDEVIDEALKSMAEMVDATFSELWIPFEDGFEREQRLVLRSNYPQEGHIVEKFTEAERSLVVDKSYIGREIFKKNGGHRIIYERDIRKLKNYAWRRMIHEFGTYKFLALPLSRNGETLGVVCLHPGPKFKLDETIREQLIDFAELAAEGIESARFRRRYKQLNSIRRGMNKLLVDDATEFYRNVAFLVRDVISAEACSVFTIDNRENNSLVLRGSSDESLETRRRIGKKVYDFEESTTGQVAKTGKPVMIYGKFHRFGKRIFSEQTRRPPSAMLAYPIRDSNDRVLGVIRCVNKVRARNVVTNTFSKADMQLFELTVGLISAIIENRRNIAELQRINERRQNFLSSVAHEFTSPLQSMRMTTEYVKRYYKEPARLKDPEAQFDFLLEEIDFLNYLIANIRTQFSDERREFGQTRLEPTNLFKLVEKIQTLLKGQAKEKGLDIKLRGYFPKQVVLDKFHFEQVVFNLLVNAIKYTRSFTERPIEIICHDNPNEILLCFRNWGIGVRQDESTRIFDIFERGLHAPSASVSGTGLGLYISRRIMKTMHGDVQLTQLQNPTEFTVYLPKR